jgi:GntR family transcriptional repressor for pyruvate dehydrogenase complex
MVPIEKGSVVHQVIQQLTDSVLNGRFKVGEKLPSEYELMAELNVSRNSIREAMGVLAAMGFIDIRRGDGTYLCSQSKPSIFDSVLYGMILESSSAEEIIDLRQILDEDVLTLAVEKCTRADIDKLQGYVDQMKESFAKDDLQTVGQLDYAFHMFMLECSRNAFFIRIVKGVYRIFESSIKKNIRIGQWASHADMYHQKMVDCISAHSKLVISDVVSSSLSVWRETIKKG